MAFSWTMKCGRFVFNPKSVTVEPVLFLYMFVTFTQFLTFQALVYRKVCMEHFNSTICDNLTDASFKAEEDIVQKASSHWLLYNNLAMGIPSLFTVVLFLGPWGDRVGRKMPLLFPLIGCLLFTVCNILNSVYITASLGYLLIGNFINGSMGGFIAMLMSAYSYIAHLSTTENRTIRIGILEAMVFLAGTVGTASSGVMLDRTSFVFVFSLLAGTVVVSIIYTLVWVDNIVHEQHESSSNGLRAAIIAAVKDVGLCVYHKRHNKNFWNLALLVFILTLLMLVTVGENDIILIYTRHAPLSWSQTTLGLYKGIETFLRGISVLTLLILVKKKFQARDTTVVIIGLISKTLSLIVLGVARKTSLLFIGVVSGMVQGFSSAAVRSMCSSMVEKDEQAKIFSLIAMFEAFATLAATSLFNTVYSATLDTYSGTCFLMAAGIMTICIGVALFLHCKLGGETRVYETLEEPPADDVPPGVIQQVLQDPTSDEVPC